MKKVILLIILVFAIGLFWWSQKSAEEPQVVIINSFDECVA